jgi:Ca-activated chloride channel family protein
MSINIKIEHDKLRANGTTSTGLLVEVTAPAAPVAETAIIRKPQGVVFVIDRSGSMGGGRLELVKHTVLDLLPRLNKDDYFSVVTFDDRPLVEIPMVRLGDANIKELVKTIQALQPGGSTNLEMGYRVGIAEAAKSPEGTECQVILLSDGQANAGVQDPAQLAQLAAAATEHLISTSTLGISHGYNDLILSALSERGNGNHFAAVTVAEAVTGLNDEFDDLLDSTITDLRVIIEYGLTHDQTGSVIRSPQTLRSFNFDGGVKAVAECGNLASEEEKNFIFEAITKMNTGENHEFTWGSALTVTCQWTELGVFKESKSFFDLSIVSDANWIEPAKDEDVVAELALSRAQDQREAAIAARRAGDYETSLAYMSDGQIRLQQMLNNPDLTERQRQRILRELNEHTNLMSMENDDEFIKRGMENLHRSRKSKADPRSKQQPVDPQNPSQQN